VGRKVEVEKTETGEKFVDEADVIISARGGLNIYKWPEIGGLETFKGKLLHSAVWDQS
jgi:cation diffusion facilitator CzcD-associated flavoprotein CzcO